MKDKKYIAKVEFVEKAINDYRKDLIEKIEKEKYAIRNEKEKYGLTGGYNRALDDIIKIIEEK